MKALILAAGYATRLKELTRDRPKPLLSVAGRTLLDHLLDKLDEIPELDSVVVVTNARFADAFEHWAKEHTHRFPITIVNDGTDSDANKLGAVGDILFTVRKLGIDDDLFVGAADNLFDFSMKPFFETFARRGSTIGLYDVGDLSVMPHYSEVQISDDQRITAFTEKPAKPVSTFMATALYAYKAEHLRLLEEYEREGGNMDSPGYFPSWLHRREPVYGHVFRGRWLDVGTPERYKEANEEWAHHGASASAAPSS